MPGRRVKLLCGGAALAVDGSVAEDDTRCKTILAIRCRLAEFGCMEFENADVMTQPWGVREASSKETRLYEMDFSDWRLRSFELGKSILSQRVKSVRRELWQIMTAQWVDSDGF
jgi:hypothetical protein